MKPTLLCLLLLGCLAACTPPDSGGPQVEIRSPAQGASLSGTVAVQVEAADDSGIAGVSILARGEGSEAQGVEVGASTLSTDGRNYFVSFAAGALPNRTKLELVAKATDATGNTGRSLPVRVETNNAGAPRLKHLIAFTTPPDPNAQTLAAGGKRGVPPVAGVRAVQAPQERPQAQATRPLQAPLRRDYVLEWGWFAEVGADGYNVLLSTDAAGPYTLRAGQAAVSGLQCFLAAEQCYSEATPATEGNRRYGTIRVRSQGDTQVSIFSNADGATFLPPHDSISPADGQTLLDGRPLLNWVSTPGAEGYWYFVYDRNPWERGARLIWTNPINNGILETTGALSVNYPATRDPLASGSYWWWVAAVSFDEAGQPDAFSFSDPKRFVVP